MLKFGYLTCISFIKLEGAYYDMSNVIAESSGSTFSRLVAWEVFNFMCVEHGKAEFDNSGILNFKGYNDSGKSTMLRALDVLMYNIKPNMQTSFIQDDKDYFRVMAYFDDGVIILRDKYINGQSLYEMYKDGNCIFSTKKGTQLTKVVGVPEVIETYLGLISHDNMLLNSRSCFDKQLLVQTTGSENYKFLNAVLKSEELAIAGELVNTDKNKLLGDISATEAELSVYKKQTEGAQGITEGMVIALQGLDRNCDVYDEELSGLGRVVETYNSAISVPDIPEMTQIDSSRVSALAQVTGYVTELGSLKIAPEISAIDQSRLVILGELYSKFAELGATKVAPEVGEIDKSRLDMLSSVYSAVKAVEGIDAVLAKNDKDLEELNSLCVEYEKEMAIQGRNYVKCPNCGTLVEAGTHVD